MNLRKLKKQKYLVLFFSFITLFKITKLIIIANSKLEICLNSSYSNANFSLKNQTFQESNNPNNSNETNLKCKEKIVVSLAIDNSKSADTDYLEAFIHEVDSQAQPISTSKNENVNSNSNNNLNYSNNSKKKLLNPIRINISKSPVYVEYPSIYFQTFNHKATEQVIISNVFSCQDGDLAQSPTCGWTLNSLNQRIPYSQGFCCKCDFGQIIGINNTDRNRGNTCKFLNLGSGSATAHCLKYDQLWWNAYEVSGYQIVYEISIFVTYLNKLDQNSNEDISNFRKITKHLRSLNQNQSKNQTDPFLMQPDSQNWTLNSKDDFTTKKLTLTPSNRIASSSDSKIVARLIGDFLPSSSISDFSNYFLLIPSFPASHPMVMQGPLNWMLIPREHFSHDGRQCNKIGVSYAAFRSHQNKCLMRIGECLNNQIADFFKADLERISTGKAANYIVSQAKLINGAEPSFYSFSNQSKKLAFKLNGVFNSLITLEIAADELKYVVNISQAKIDFVIIEAFENNSKNGLLQLQLTNIGKLTAEFSISFLCSEYVLPLTSEQISLYPFQSKLIKKNIFTVNTDEDFKQFNFTLNHNCTVKVFDYNANLLDEKMGFFNTTKIEEINFQLPQNSTTNNNAETSNDYSESLENSENVKLGCSLLCPDFFGFLCFVVHGCWGFFIRTALILLILIGLLALFIRSVKNGSFFIFIKKAFSCFFTFGKKEIKENDKIIKNKTTYACDANDLISNNNRNYNNYNCKRDDFNLKKRIEIIETKMFLNFSNVNFDFSHAGLLKNFSLEVNVLYCFTDKRPKINQIDFPNNFIDFCHNSGFSEVVNFRFLKDKIRYLPNFLTKMPLYCLFR